MKTKFTKYKVSSIFMALVLVLPFGISAQNQNLHLPDGESVKLDVKSGKDGSYREVVFTSKHSYYRDSINEPWQDFGKSLDDIIDASSCLINDTIHIFSLYADGSIQELNAVTRKKQTLKTKINIASFEAFEKLTGDDMYALSNLNLYVSRDHGGSWNSDTAGLKGVYMNDVALDTSQNVYLATSKGVYMQPAKGGAWTLLTTPLSNVSKIFISSKNEFYISSNYHLYKSVDGINWNLFNAGLNNQYPVKFGQDTAGNVFIITSNTYGNNGNDLYKYDGTKWTSIGADIIKLNYDASNTAIFNSISGGKTIYASTVFGLFKSDDQGTTWKDDNKGIKAENAAGMVVTSNGTKVITTSRGMFYQMPAGANWIQTLHPNLYQAGQRIYVDKNDIIYTPGELIPSVNFSSFNPRVIYKSTDLGKTWAPDTAGIYKTNMYRFFVDENGVQYMGGGSGSQVYVKTQGQSWKIDTAGLSIYKIGLINAYGSDKKGTIYMSTVSNSHPLNFKRPQAGGSWVADSAGAMYHQTVFDFYADGNGNFYGGTYGGGLIKRTSTGWKKLNSPSGSGGDVLAISSDKSGALFAGFSHTDASFNEIGDGVFFTLDSGANWHNVSKDASTFIEFVADADTVFGVSYHDGVYAFTEKTTGVEPHAEHYESILYPNPGNGVFHIMTSQKEPGRMELEIYDIQGRSVCRKEFANSNNDVLNFDLSSCNNGVYFYRLIGSNNIETGKIILRK